MNHAEFSTYAVNMSLHPEKNSTDRMRDASSNLLPIFQFLLFSHSLLQSRIFYAHREQGCERFQSFPVLGIKLHFPSLEPIIDNQYADFAGELAYQRDSSKGMQYVCRI